jgi:AcrR family transcriptional regulator
MVAKAAKPPRKPRKRREQLTRERILDASMHIAETEGLEALSMRRVGSELHVKDMALYHYFDSKDEILDGLVDRMFEAFSQVTYDGTSSWQNYMKAVMQSFRSVGKAYPQTFLLYARKPWRAGHRTGDIDPLLLAGFDREHAGYVLRNLVEYVTGFVLRNDIRRSIDRTSYDDALDYSDADEAFRYGLSAMLIGFEQLLSDAKKKVNGKQ